MTEFVEGQIDILVYWIRERERIRILKESGAPKPWTEDVLLRDFRWCNVRRLDDKVSRWLFEHWYQADSSEEHTLRDVAWARLVNWPEALAEISHGRDPIIGRIVLTDRAARGCKVFTGAYVVPGVQGRAKVESVSDLVQRIQSEVRIESTMKETWSAIMALDGVGTFLAGQMVADLAHLPAGQHWPDKTTWAARGPGSARGINRLRGLPKDKPVCQADFEVLLRDYIAHIRPRVEDIAIDRNLHATDFQSSLCEGDKYFRLLLEEGQVRAHYDGRSETTMDMF